MRAGPLRHIVFFQFTDAATEADIRGVVIDFLRLGETTPEVRGIEWGVDCGIEHQSDGFTHAFQLTFDDVAARDRYVALPEHERFSAAAGPRLERVVGLDYVVEPPDRPVSRD